MKKTFLFTFIIITLLSSPLSAQIDSVNQFEPARFLLEPDEDKLVETLRVSIATDSSNTRNYLVLASLLENQLKFDEAEAIYQRALVIDSTCSKCWQQLAGVMVAKGMVRNAINHYNQSLELDSTNSSARIQLARLLKRENSFKESLKHWWVLLGNDSTNYYVWEQIGDCSARIGEGGWAWTAYMNSLNYNPKNLPVAAKIGQMGIRQNVWTIFFEPIIDEALKVDSLYIPLLRVKGTLFFNAKNYKETLRFYEVAYNQGDTSKVTLKHMGISYFNEGYNSKSVEFLSRVYQQDSSDIVLNYFYSNALINIGDRKIAIEVLNSTEEMMKPDLEELSLIYFTRAEAYTKGREYQLAIDQLIQAIELTPARVDYLYRIAQQYDYNLKDQKKALEYYELYLQKIADLPEENAAKRNEGMATRAVKRLKEGLFFEDELILIKSKKKE